VPKFDKYFQGLSKSFENSGNRLKTAAPLKVSFAPKFNQKKVRQYKTATFTLFPKSAVESKGEIKGW
jgi:hypothetical protein